MLALWRLGMVVAQSCAVTAVSRLRAGWLARPAHTVRQQVREFVSDRDAKRGARRQELAVRTGCRPRLAWVLHGSRGTQRAVALAATTVGDRFTVLAVSVRSRGGAIPVAWTVLRAQDPHAWRQAWRVLLRLLGRPVPRAWTVLVLADRGRDARWLYRRIVRLGWHPFLRVTLGGTVRPAGQAAYRPLGRFTPPVGTA